MKLYISSYIVVEDKRLSLALVEFSATIKMYTTMKVIIGNMLAASKKQVFAFCYFSNVSDIHY